LKGACENVLSQRVLIVFSLSRDPSSAVRNELRFSRFANILQEAGFASTPAQADSLSCLDGLIDRVHPDIVFCALDHLSDAEGGPVNVHGWLGQRNIPYIGSPPEVIELALNKTALKRKWLADGIATPEFLDLDFSMGPTPIEEGMLPPFPCIVKPSDAGNSRGITKDSVVFDIQGVKAQIGFLANEFRHILIEHYLGLYPDFREITCACIGNGPERLLMPAELVFLKPEGLHVITTQDKNRERTKARAMTDEDMREAAKAFAGRVFDSAGVRDYSRCDLVFAGGKFWAIEVNGQPMIPDSWFESCALYAGLDEKAYIAAIIDAANRRLFPKLDK
jgi:D-alanine-D-alanine ligase